MSDDERQAAIAAQGPWRRRAVPARAIAAVAFAVALAGCGRAEAPADRAASITPAARADAAVAGAGAAVGAEAERDTAELAAFYQGADQACGEAFSAASNVHARARSVVQAGSVLLEIQQQALRKLRSVRAPADLRRDFQSFVRAVAARHVATARFTSALRNHQRRRAGLAGTAMNDEMRRAADLATKLGLGQCPPP